ncbi:MAG: hypothetical protein QW832_02670 [archaeon]
MSGKLEEIRKLSKNIVKETRSKNKELVEEIKKLRELNEYVEFAQGLQKTLEEKSRERREKIIESLNFLVNSIDDLLERAKSYNRELRENPNFPKIKKALEEFAEEFGLKKEKIPEIIEKGSIVTESEEEIFPAHDLRYPLGIVVAHLRYVDYLPKLKEKIKKKINELQETDLLFDPKWIMDLKRNIRSVTYAYNLCKGKKLAEDIRNALNEKNVLNRPIEVISHKQGAHRALSNGWLLIELDPVNYDLAHQLVHELTHAALTDELGWDTAMKVFGVSEALAFLQEKHLLKDNIKKVYPKLTKMPDEELLKQLLRPKSDSKNVPNQELIERPDFLPPKRITHKKITESFHQSGDKIIDVLIEEGLFSPDDVLKYLKKMKEDGKFPENDEEFIERLREYRKKEREGQKS